MAGQLEVSVRSGGRAGGIPLALGGMIGAGVFAGFAPAASAAGSWLLVAVPLAAMAAACCAFSSADQSGTYRGPGAGYACARSRLGPVPARMAAGTHLAGLVAAMAAIAGAIGEYLLPGSAPATAALALLLVVLAATAGLRIRGLAAWLWLGLTLVVLAVVVAACFSVEPPPVPAVARETGADNPLGITGAAGVLFFAFLGFERLTAPAEERDRYPGRALRRGLVVALVAATVLHLVVGAALLHQLGPVRLALSPVPVEEVLSAAGAASLRPAVGLGVALALLPVLLGALESFRSTALAVVRDRDLPAWLGRTGSQGTPHLLDLSGGLAAAGAALLFEPAELITAAACCVLVHYAFTNAGARLLLAEDRTWPMRTACAGMVVSVVLAMSMPVPAMLVGLAAVVAGPVVGGLVSGRWR